MVKLVDPLRSAEARGKLGNLVYNTNRGTRYARTKVTPAKLYTTKQITVREQTSDLTALWKTLTQIQRDAWNSYASKTPVLDWTGSNRRLSGFNWFIKCNWFAYFASLALPYETPPSTPAPDVVPITRTWTSGNRIFLEWYGGPPYPPPTEYVQLWYYGPHSTGSHPPIELSHLEKWVLRDDAGISFYIHAAGQYTMWVRSFDATSGLFSTWSRSTIYAPYI